MMGVYDDDDTRYPFAARVLVIAGLSAVGWALIYLLARFLVHLAEAIGG